MERAAEPFVSIILVNYNGWQDTIECLESLLKIDYTNYNIVVVDNASSDNSTKNIKDWANGNLIINCKQSDLSKKLAFPLSTKPIALSEQDAINFKLEDFSKPQITLIKSLNNLGFAGGNNVATKFMMSLDEQPDFIWYLNNDTVVERNTLNELTTTFQIYINRGIKLGILGSKLFYYDKPDKIQAIIGEFKPLFANTKHIGLNEVDSGQYDNIEIKKNYYVIGASMFVYKQFINDVGLMSEDYFIYFEEIDWITRGKKYNYQIALCPSAIIYHKEGASTGSNNNDNTRSAISEYYDLRNRIKITRKFYSVYYPSVYFYLLLIMINKIRKKQIPRAKMIAKIFLNIK